MKKCSKCQANKPIYEFGRDSRHSDGLQSQCNRCVLDARKLKISLDRAGYNARQKEYRSKNPGRTRKYGLSYMYGMTVKEYGDKLESQAGVCDLCGLPPLTGKPLSVDHDHKTDKIRGLIHGTCNSGLGMFSDDADRLELAAKYLRKHSGI